MKSILNKFSIDYSTYFLIILALFAGYMKNVFIILIIVLVHELGHIFFFSLFKIDILSIKIYPFGGVTLINKRLHERIYKDILCSIGGVLFQLFIFLLGFILFYQGIILESTYNLFCLYNKSILVFNLIPIIPLDGSKFLFAIFSKFLPYKISYILMVIVGVLSLILFIIYNFIFKLNDIILYIFLISKLFNVIKNYKYVLNKFYLERIMYKHYYDGIISNCNSVDKIKLNKLYFFKVNSKYVNEKDYIKKTKYGK